MVKLKKKSKATVPPITDTEREVLQNLARKELAIRHGIICDSTGMEYELRGACKEFVENHDKQCIVSGVADSGKTVAACIKIHQTALKYPKCQGAIARKSYASLTGTVIQTFERIVGIDKNGISSVGTTRYGGGHPQWYDYSNGSRIWVGGMDNPDKILSSERDYIYVNQAEELEQTDWEILSTRTTGRGAVIPFPQLMGDCNPGGSRHWIRELSKIGTLTLLVATHKDNPTIYELDGTTLTASGASRLDSLDKLTGMRRRRLFEGIWATAEGAVYDTFNNTIHVKVRPVLEFKRWFLAMDEGYTNPAVILLIGEDSDKRIHVAQEFYHAGVLQETVVKEAKKWFTEFNCELAAVDEAAAGLIADLQAVGVRAVGGKGRVLDGIQKIQDRLQVQGDGRPRLTIDPGCVNLINEMESYVWKPEKDVPVKENDHAADSLRYWEDVMAVPSGALDDRSKIYSGVRQTNVRTFEPRTLMK